MIPPRDNQAADSIISYRVGSPFLPTFASFREAVDNVDTRSRTAKARQQWALTDGMRVQSYAFTLDLLHIRFDDATLEIRASGSVVSWDVLRGFPSTPLPPCPNPCVLIHAEQQDRRELFDRDAVLRNIVGKHIRYAPCATGLYILWHPEKEIGILSLPLVDQVGWILSYS